MRASKRLSEINDLRGSAKLEAIEGVHGPDREFVRAGCTDREIAVIAVHEGEKVLKIREVAS